jgi:hypothetical protein
VISAASLRAGSDVFLRRCGGGISMKGGGSIQPDTPGAVRPRGRRHAYPEFVEHDAAEEGQCLRDYGVFGDLHQVDVDE